MPRITIDNLSSYPLNGESEIIEFKRSIPPRIDVIGRIISAFANTKGGSIIFMSIIRRWKPIALRDCLPPT